jgi:predicted nucleic acid-binding protein
VTEYFADTFYWLAALNPDDAHHGLVTGVAIGGVFVLTDGVRLEVMDALSACRNRAKALRFWNYTNTAPDVVIIPADEDRLTRAADLFRRRPDKDWSLTDCLSFVVMADRNIRTALTADHHFEQAGFEIAFKPPA